MTACPNPATDAVEGELVLADARLAPYSDGRVWNEALVVREIHLYAEEIVVSAHEIGRRLLWTKEVVGHGNFGAWCERNLPFSERTVYNYMQVATFLTANPGLCRVAARAGLKRTLLLTTLAPDQVEQVMADGHMAEAPIDGLDKVPYWKLKQEVDRLKRGGGEADSRLARAESELARAKEAVADLSGALDVADEDQLARIVRVREQLTDAVILAHAQLVPLADRMARGELAPRIAAELVGVLEYADVLVRNTVYQARARIGEGSWSEAIAENLERDRCAEAQNPIPEVLQPPKLAVAPRRGSR